MGSPDIAARKPTETTLLDLTVSADVDRCVVRLAGDLDLCSAGLLEENLTALLDSGCRDITVDLSRLAFCDCAGLSALIGARLALGREGGDLTLAGATGQVRRIIELAGFLETCDIDGVPPSAGRAATDDT